MSTLAPALRAIPTAYKGYALRSRLEGRWLTFLDELGEPWRYEDEGFDLDGTWYLPDVWLPRLDCWLEIKPGPMKPEEETKAGLLAVKSGKWVNVVCGSPWPGEYALWAFRSAMPPQSMAAFLDLALEEDHPFIFGLLSRGHSYFVEDWRKRACEKFGYGYLSIVGDQDKPYRKQERVISFCDTCNTLSFSYVFTNYTANCCSLCGNYTEIPERTALHPWCFVCAKTEHYNIGNEVLDNPRLRTAFHAARSARFGAH